LLIGGAMVFACSHREPSGSQTTNTSTSSLGGMGGTTGIGGSTVSAGGVGGATTGQVSSTANGGTAGGPGEFVEPQWLSETGLYESDMVTLAEGVLPFQPQFALWSDTAAKQRWIKLPPDEQIDTSDMDYWVYPVGTKLFKEFVRDGIRVETRLLQKKPDGSWFMRAFQWNEAQTDAEAKRDGWLDASNTQHDIPSENQCINCHEKVEDVALGFSAVQLSHDAAGVTLDQLIAEGRLSDPPEAPIELPGNEVERAALGYLHANCGNCHNPRSFVSSMVNMQLWLSTSALGSVAETPTVKTSVNVRAVAPFYFGAGGEGGQASLDTRIVPGDAENSIMYQRMRTRVTGSAMPPVGTELVDEEGSATVKAWIDAMSPDG